MKSIKSFVALLAVGLVVACGGGGKDAGDSLFGGGPGAAPQAADLTLVLTGGANGTGSSLENNGLEKITATVTAVDAGRNALAGIPVTVSVDANAVATVSGSATDSEGKVTAEVGIGADKSNRVITVTARSGELVRTATFSVIGSRLTASPSQSVVNPGEQRNIEFRLLDANSNPMSGQAIVVSAPDGTETRGTTGINGEFNFGLTAPTTAGTQVFRATAGGASTDASVTVAATVPPGTVTPQSTSVSANPSVVPVNSDGGTSNRSEIRALFLGANNAPAPNVRVRFDLAGDVNSIGGTFTSGSNVVYTDANGVATTAYIPAARSSPTGGVTIRACWSLTDFAANTCPNSTTTTLTVVAEALSVSIGTDGVIETVTAEQSYVKRFVVQVVDASGRAKADVQVTPSVDLLRYAKGFWSPGSDRWVQSELATCDNEDLNRNGVAETYANFAVEDANGSASMSPPRPALDPRKADVSLSIEGNGRTSANGVVVLRIQYPQNVASWVEFNLLVAAGGVSGTEGRANFQGVLPVPGPVVTNLQADPPFRYSPYGTQGSAVVFTVNPDGQSGLLCTNPF